MIGEILRQAQDECEGWRGRHDASPRHVLYVSMFGKLKKSVFGPLSVGPGIYQIRALGARVTVIASDNGPVMVDVGHRGSAPVIGAGLGAAKLAYPDIELIIMTHHHPDHSGALSGVSRRSGAAIAVHETESDFLNGKQRPPNPYTPRIVSAATSPFVGPMYGRPVEIEHRLHHGDSLPTCEHVRVVHTPGHTAGSITLLSEEHGWLVVGDALQHRLGRLSGPAKYVTSDYGVARTSLKKLLNYDFDSIWFSHFPPIRQGAKRRLARLVDSFS